MVTTRNGRIAIVTVHGTGDTATGPDGDKWFQNGSLFSARLVDRLKAHGLEAEIVPHLWNGANSARARETAGEKLAAHVRKISASYDDLHIIGHSHGGNVANEALLDLRWGHGETNRSRIASVIAVGTPFLDTRSEATAAVVWIVQLLSPLLAIAALVYGSISLGMGPASRMNWQGWVLLAGFIAPCAFLIGIGLTRFRKQSIASRASPKRKYKKALVSIWHPNDEAISFLQTVHQLKMEPFPKGALFKSAEGAASIWAARTAVIFMMFGLVSIFAADLAILPLVNLNALTDINGFTALALGAGPLAYFLTYVIVRALLGFTPELGRKALNSGVSDAVRGFAFGRDSERQIVSSAPTSFSYECRTIELGADCIERMKANSADSLTRLIEKYRWTMFSVGADTTSVLADISADTMTWDSLIHTTYFDQPEILDHIVAEIVGFRQSAPTVAGAGSA